MALSYPHDDYQLLVRANGTRPIPFEQSEPGTATEFSVVVGGTVTFQHYSRAQQICFVYYSGSTCDLYYHIPLRQQGRGDLHRDAPLSRSSGGPSDVTGAPGA